MAGLCKGGNEPPGFLKANQLVSLLYILTRITSPKLHIEHFIY